jgi:ABC-type glycerol-3-phosphate transport system permease component
MATEPKAAPHIATVEQLAHGEEPAVGTPTAPAVPGRTKGQIAGRLVLYLILLAVAVLYLLPFFWTVSTSFKSLPESVKGFVLIPHHPTLSGYREAFTTGPFDRYFLNSAIFAVTVTLSNLFLCTLGGYAFARLRFPLR